MSKASFISKIGGLKGALNYVWRGSIAPFDRLPLSGDSAGDKIKSPYQQSVWVQRAIKTVANPIASVPLCFYEGETELEDPALTAFWENPARGLSRADFIEALAGWLKLEGEAFILLDDNFLVPFPEIRTAWPQLILARPDRMREVITGGTLAGWQFLDGKGKSFTLLPEQVIHLKFWNPYNEWRGLSELEAAFIAADADYLSANFERNLMAANGDRGNIVIAKGGALTDPQKTQIEAALRQKQAAVRSGNFRTIFLTGDVAIEDPKIQAPDANFVASRLQKRHEIAIAFGVPPSMFDVVASYSVGSASDRFRLIEETAMPLSAKIAGGISLVVGKMTGRALKAEFDWDEHSVMQQVRSERVASAVQLFDRGHSWETLNDYLALGLKPFEGWEKRYLPFSLQEAGSDVETDVQPAPAPAEGLPITEQLRALFNSKLKSQNSNLAAQPHLCAADPGFERSIEGSIRLKRAKLKKFFFDQRVFALRKLEALNNEVGTRCPASTPDAQQRVPTTRAITEEDINRAFDTVLAMNRKWLDAENKKLLALMKPALITDLEFGGAQIAKEVGIADFKLAPQETLNYFENRRLRIEEVNSTTFDGLKAALIDGVKSGDTFEQLTDRVRAEFNTASTSRAETIALTETNTAVNSGRQTAMEQVGVERKGWVTAHLEGTRVSHKLNEDFSEANNGIPIGDLWPNGLAHPCDPDGDPSQVINCRCIGFAVMAAKGVKCCKPKVFLSFEEFSTKATT